MMKTKPDQTMEEIWAIRRALAKKFDYDPSKAGAYYRRLEKKSGAKMYHHDSLGRIEVDALNERASVKIAPPQPATLTSYRITTRNPKAKRAK